MNEFEILAEATGSVVLRHNQDGMITYATPTAAEQLGYDSVELLGMNVGELFPEEETGGPLGNLSMEGQSSASEFLTETEVVTKRGKTDPVELRRTPLPDSDEVVLNIRSLGERKRRELYLQFARDVNELIIRADDEPRLLQQMIETVQDRQFGCTSICLLDERGKIEEIYGVMEDWCEMDWETVYTPAYISEVLDHGDIIIEDVTQGPHPHHTVEKLDHGAIALTLAHRGNQYGILTMHLPGKGSALSNEERDLLRELADNISTGLYNLRTEAELRETRKQLAVLDRVLRHNLRNVLSIVMGSAEIISESTTGSPQQHSKTIRIKSRELLQTAEKEREIVELIVGEPEATEFDLVDAIERCVEAQREKHPQAEIATDLPKTARVAAIQEITRALEELVTNALEHNDHESPRVTISLRCRDDHIEIEVADNGLSIPEQETKVLASGQQIEHISHGSGLGLRLVNWIVKRSNGDVQFHEREPRGNLVRIKLRSRQPARSEAG